MVRAETLLALETRTPMYSASMLRGPSGDPLPTVRVAALQGFAKRGEDTLMTCVGPRSRSALERSGRVGVGAWR